MAAEILVNGHPFQTTLNLNAALQNFRDIIPGVRLWVDAICVNQNDLAERGQQVQLMKSIYSRAEETYVWLGIQSNDSDKAIDFMELLAARYRDCIARTPVGGKANFGTFESTVSWDVVKSFAALERLLVRPWWDRVWIVQEIVQGASRVTHINNLRRSFGPNADLQTVEYHRSLLTLLVNHRPTESTDARDKYIALAGVANDTSSFNNTNAYFERIPNTFIAATKLVTVNRRVSGLNFLDHAGRPRNRADLPSWVPDWRYNNPRPKELLLWQWNLTHRARNSVPYNALPKFRFQKGSSLLLAQGVLFDNVDGVAPNERAIIEAHTNSVSVYTEDYNLAVQQPELHNNAYPNEDTTEIFWRTLVLNRESQEGYLPPEDWKAWWNAIFQQNEDIEIFGSSGHHKAA